MIGLKAPIYTSHWHMACLEVSTNASAMNVNHDMVTG